MLFNIKAQLKIMTMIQIPKYKFNQLDKISRKLVLAVIRHTVLNSPQMVRELGFDCTEEAIISLLDKGLVKVVEKTIDGESYVALAFYHLKTGKYFVVNSREEVD